MMPAQEIPRTGAARSRRRTAAGAAIEPWCRPADLASACAGATKVGHSAGALSRSRTVRGSRPRSFPSSGSTPAKNPS